MREVPVAQRHRTTEWDPCIARRHRCIHPPPLRSPSWQRSARWSGKFMRADESAITIITAMQDRERAHGMQGRECALAYLPSLRTKFCTVSSSTASRDVAAGPCPVAGSWRPSTAMRAEPGEISVSDDHCNILTGYLVYLLPSFALDTAIAILHSHRGPWTSAREPCRKPPTCMLRRSAHCSNVKPRSIPRAKHTLLGSMGRCGARITAQRTHGLAGTGDLADRRLIIVDASQEGCQLLVNCPAKHLLLRRHSHVTAKLTGIHELRAERRA